jgi:hypothetical protein
MLGIDGRRLRGAFLILAWFLGGCSLPIFTHIHNDGRAATAHEAQNAMSQYGKNSPAMYSAMTENIELFASEEDTTVSAFAANKSTALVTELPSMSNGKFAARIKQEEEATASMQRYILRAVSQALHDIKREEIESDTLEHTVQAAKTKVDTQKDRVTAWNGQVAFFQVVIQELPQAEVNLSKTADASKFLSDPRQLVKIAQQAGSTEIKYTDADGKAKSSTVSEFVGANFTTVSDQALKGEVPNAFQDAPGVDLAIANLALDLSQLEQKRAQMRLAQDRTLLELLQKTWNQLAIAERLLKSADDGYTFSDNGKAVYNEILTAAQKKSSTELGRQDEVAKLLLCFREEAIAESIVSRLGALTPLAIDRMIHINGIADAEINDQEYQSLITSGLVGLVSYHDGGLTAQDVANVINFAQAVGVGVIAGRIH